MAGSRVVPSSSVRAGDVLRRAVGQTRRVSCDVVVAVEIVEPSVWLTLDGRSRRLRVHCLDDVVVER